MRKLIYIGLGALGVSSASFAQNLREVFVLTPGQAGTMTSTGTGPVYSGGFSTFTSVGGYTLRRFRFTGGALERQAGWTGTGDTLSENRISMWQPGTTTGAGNRNITTGGAFSPNVTASNSGSTTAYVTGDNYTNAFGQGTAITAAAGFDPAGAWTYQFWNLDDDNGVAGVDAWFNTVNVELWDNTDNHLTNVDLGTNPNTQLATGGLAPYQVRWYAINLSADVSAASGNYIDIETVWNSGNNPVGPANQGNIDTHMGLYRSDGTLVVGGSDDDSGMGRYSALSFGATFVRTPTTAPTGSSAWNSAASLNLIGQDGTLTAGTYYLAVTSFSPTYESGFMVFGGANGEGQTSNFDLKITSTVPEPATFAVLELGAAALIRRRKARKA